MKCPTTLVSDGQVKKVIKVYVYIIIVLIIILFYFQVLEQMEPVSWATVHSCSP